jgi:ribonuclease III
MLLFKKSFKKRSKEATFQKRIQYVFKRPELLLEALTHPSYTCEHPERPHYQRLEFLGDSVLGLVVTSWLFEKYPNAAEGDLTTAKSALTSRSALAALAKKIDLGHYIHCASSEKTSRPSILENTYEALIGAIFCDSSFTKVQKWIQEQVGPLPNDIFDLIAPLNPKGRLQEHCQAKGLPYEYLLIEASGPDHAKMYRVAVHVNSELSGSGSGSSKKEAEEAAAKDFLSKLAQFQSL